MDDSIEKILDEKTTEEERNALIAELPPEEITKLKTRAKEVAAAELAKISGIRAEKNRVTEQVTEKTGQLKQANQTMEQFREEQVSQAREGFLSQYKVAPEKLEEFDATFKQLDSGKVTAALIMKDMVKAYAAVDAEGMVAALAQKTVMEANAAAGAIQAAGSIQAPPPSKEPQKYSDEVVALAKAADISVEAAEKQLTQGMNRVHA